MVTITDGANVLCVTNGAYKSQYEPFGWRIVPQGQDVELPRVAEDREIKKAEKLKNKALKELTDKKLPTDLVDKLIGKDE